MAVELYINQLVDWIISLSPVKIYLIFAIVAYIENVLPPVPGDLLVAFGGYLAAEQIVGFAPLLAITTVASVVGFMNMYLIGAHFGHKIEEHRSRFWLMRIVDVKYYDKVKRWMQRWGLGVILANRFLAGTRSVISLASGVSRTRVSTTIICAAVSSILWNFLLLGAGWLINENWQVIGDYLNIYGWTILVMLIVLIGARILYKKRYKTKGKKPGKNFSERVD
ncbi:DedA family protein [Rhodohalobacter halophilus]|uniref:DedA family protein n=1 Tax=Rhodohalobacter halophilus TaxID=1812810 RepID=UPI00083FCF3A|nr:DedA family protein [Rhodohalobacter halophilus]